MEPPQTQSWNQMPGWGIVANLTPPELIASRRLRTVRKGILVAVTVMVLLAALGYGYAWMQARHASSALAAESARSGQLLARQHEYDDITKIKGNVAQVQKQVSGLMGNDVDFAALVQALRRALPPGMTINQMTVNLAFGNGNTAGSAKSGTSIDTSGRAHIGSITLTGAGLKVEDVASYMDKLRTIAGVVDVLPTSNQATGTGIQYNLSLALTDQLLSHRFDVSGKGSK
jgi:hypothetical protein